MKLATLHTGMGSALEFGFEVGWSSVGVEMAGRVSLCGINLERALGACEHLHLRAVGNGLRHRVLVAGLRGAVLHRSTVLSPDLLETAVCQHPIVAHARRGQS